jgi:hypothetical protein
MSQVNARSKNRLLVVALPALWLDAAFAAGSAKAPVDLTKADAARGCGDVPLVYDVTLHGLFGHPAEEGPTTRRFRVETSNHASLITWTDPPRPADATAALVREGVWLRVEARAPGPRLLTPDDRRYGIAAIGEILATCFTHDFDVVADPAAPPQRLTLKARRPMALTTVTLTLEPKTQLVASARFVAEGGGAAYEAAYEYRKNATIGGRRGPFLSRMRFSGKDAAPTVDFAEWTMPAAGKFDAAYFDLANVANRLKAKLGSPGDGAAAKP